jgi:uncharacterized membrane protein YukC
MTKKTIIQELEALVTDETIRSKAARLRDIIDTVEAILAAGVPRASVVKKLSEHGLEMTLGTFNTELQRIRKKRGKPSASPSNSSKSEPNKAKASTVQESPKNEKTEQEQENDYDELAGLSAREKRERRIAQFFDETPENPLLRFLKDTKK